MANVERKGKKRVQANGKMRKRDHYDDVVLRLYTQGVPSKIATLVGLNFF